MKQRGAPQAAFGSAQRALADEVADRGSVELSWFAALLAMNYRSFSETCKISPRKARKRHVFESIARKLAENLVSEGTARIVGERVEHVL